MVVHENKQTEHSWCTATL